MKVTDFFLTEPVTCYLLDGILIIYCIIATALFFREKISHIPPVVVTEDKEGVYQELERTKDADPYQVLEPTKRKKKANRKRKPQSTQAEERDNDPFESLVPGASPPPLSPR